MPTTLQIDDGLIRDSMTRAVQDVFKTMLGQDISLVKATERFEPREKGAPAPPIVNSSHPQVVGTVGFIGEINGLIYLYMSDEFAKIVTSRLLDLAPGADDDEVINDAIGEITNMVVGGFKSALSHQGLACKLTIPSILRGSNFSVEHISSAERRIYHFDCAGHRFVTDILIKIGD